ncbi:unnamed protein product [Adineta steineri]|uniref:Glycoside hydrolase family 19 catalytic domain-containing protein n=1 Tax=Adineta steineri TaxID=433720 RepID=A0A813Q4K0_9BILA|nr:unnamed protein product [Adineta steineri]CAF0797485.1 unnamed protein product [Adineta steineri]
MFALLLLTVVMLCAQQSSAIITAEQLKAIMPKCKHPEYLNNINDALVEGSINTCLRQSAFLAQLAHESGQLVYMEEIANGSDYEGRIKLGNTEPGDGMRFKGRGPIQLTGRANYAAAGKALGLDLVNNPEQVKTPYVGFRTSVWFWTNRQLNALADQGTLDSFRQITKKVNGGTNGQADREQYWAKAKNVLGCDDGSVSITLPTCTANGVSGVCMSTTNCKGRSVAGHCAGPKDIQCCI